jgi:surface antigen
LSELQQQQRETAARIAAAQAEIARLEGELGRLTTQAVTYNNEIARLDAEARTLQARIDLNTAEYDRLKNEIIISEQKITDNKDALGLILLDLYNTRNVTLIERLASSHNLSEFISREAQLDNISGTITDTVAQIEALKAELERQQWEVQRILEDLNAQRAALAEKRAEQQRLLNYNAQQRRNFTASRNAAQRERAQLEEQQQSILRAIMALGNQSGVSAGDPNKGGYPWAHLCPAARINRQQFADPWGMFICECVSYVAWRVHNAYGFMPRWGGNWSGGLRGGNAKEWLHNARVAGIPTGTTPRVGSVGVITSGTWGHVVWVEAVQGNRVFISQYNYAVAATNWVGGEYSEMWVNASVYDGFIYFADWRR